MNTYSINNNASTEEHNEKRYTVLFISLLILFTVGMSYFFFSHQSLRLDESQSLWQTSRTTLTVIEIVAKDVHVPLYHILLHFWQTLFGNDVQVVRALSLIFAILSIPAMYMLGKISYNRYVGLFGALLLAISPFFNWYGNEVRMYSLFALLTILNQYFFIKIFKEKELAGPGAWWGYGITLILGMFTHYFFGLALITQVAFYFMYKKWFSRGSFVRFAGIIAILALLFGPWLYYVMTLGGASNSQPLLVTPTSVNLFNTFSQFLFGFQNDHINTILVSLWPLTVLLVFLSMRKQHRLHPETAYFLLGVFLPIVIVFIVSSTLRPVFVTRYLILTLPSLYMVISWMFSTYPDRLSRFFKVLLVVVMLSTLAVEVVSTTTPVKEHYREASMYMEDHARPEDVIVVSAPFTIYPVLYYYRGPARIETLPLWNRYVTGPVPPFEAQKLSEDVKTLAGDHQTLWLLMSYDQGYADDIKQYFDENYERLEMKTFSPGLSLYAYKLRYDDIDAAPLENTSVINTPN